MERGAAIRKAIEELPFECVFGGAPPDAGPPVEPGPADVGPEVAPEQPPARVGVVR